MSRQKDQDQEVVVEVVEVVEVDSVGFDFVNAKMVHLFFVVIVIVHFVVVVWKQKQMLFGIRVPNLDPLQQRQQQVVQQWVVVLMAQVVG